MNLPLDKPRWPLAEAVAVAEELRDLLAPVCVRVEIAGSIRRRKPTVGDIELVFIPLWLAAPGFDLFLPAVTSMVDNLLAAENSAGRIQRRLSVRGTSAWGPAIKLARHTASGIPVDFFATTETSWWNYLVCRTGGAVSNTRIAGEAKARGWKWNMTGPGFVRRSGPDRGRVVPMHSEREVFEFVKLPYLEPEGRK